MGVIPSANDLPPGSQDWKRYVDARMDALEQNTAAADQSIYNSLSSVQNSFNLLTSQVQKVPIVLSHGINRYGGSLTSSFAEIASVTINCPTDKNAARIIAIGSAVYLDTLTGGVTSAYARLSIAGVYPSPDYPSTKDSGASQVNNVITAHNTWYTRLVPGASYAIRLDGRGLNGSAFPANPQNFASLSVLVSYTYLP